MSNGSAKNLNAASPNPEIPLYRNCEPSSPGSMFASWRPGEYLAALTRSTALLKSLTSSSVLYRRSARLAICFSTSVPSAIISSSVLPLATFIATFTISLPNSFLAFEMRSGLKTISPLSLAISNALLTFTPWSSAIAPVRYKRVVKSDTSLTAAKVPPITALIGAVI